MRSDSGAFLLAIEDKQALERAFEDVFGRSVELAWRESVLEMRQEAK